MEDDDSYYLSGYLDSLGSLPDDVKKTFAKMLELDTKNAEITKEIDAISEDYKRKVEEKRLHPRRRKAEMEKIAKMFDEAKINSDVKVKLAIDTYELVDKHINKLDADLVKFETEMREAGGRLSQTESEDEEIVRQKKEKKKKKKALMREEEGKKKAEPVTPVTPCAEVIPSKRSFDLIKLIPRFQSWICLLILMSQPTACVSKSHTGR